MILLLRLKWMSTVEVAQWGEDSQASSPARVKEWDDGKRNGQTRPFNLLEQEDPCPRVLGTKYCSREFDEAD